MTAGLVALVALVGSGSVSADAGPPPSYYYPVTGQIAVGEQQRGFVVDIALNTAYVANEVSSTVSVIDLADDTVTATIPVDSSPHSLALDTSTHAVIVANRTGNSVSIIDGVPDRSTTHTVVATVPLPNHAYSVAVDSDTGTILASYEASNMVTIDEATAKVTGHSEVGFGFLNQIDLDATTHMAWVADSSGTVDVVDISSLSVVATIPVGRIPMALQIDPTTRRAYVANGEDNSVSVIDMDTKTVINTIGVGVEPFSIGLDPARGLAYTANQMSPSVSVIDTTTDKVVDTVPMDDYPSMVGVDPASHRVFVGGLFNPSLRVITPTPLVRAAVTGLSSTSGPAAGGEQVTITGSHFGGADRVLFGTTRASFTVVSDTEITATAPAHAAGVVPVRVRTLGLSAKKPASRYRYQ